MTDATRFPLCWPPGRARTKFRTNSRFVKRSMASNGWKSNAAITLAEARDGLMLELSRLNARDVILSTNVELRRDGLPYSGAAQPSDPGAAVYFTYKGREMAFACDRWDKVADNIRAIAKTIEALRGIERWGTGEMVEAAFTGFAALPAARVAHRHWSEVLGVGQGYTTESVHNAYRTLALEHHPDRGGDVERMQEINGAWDEFKKERGL